MIENPQHREQSYPELDYLAFFTTPYELPQEETDLANLPQEKYNHVAVVGRFQPLHYGHVYLLKQASVIGKEVTIGVGSVNLMNENNPFTFYQREYMLRKVIRREQLEDKIKTIVPLTDYSDDNAWIEQVLLKTGDIHAVIGNNEWVNKCFAARNIPAVEVPLLQRGVYEGKKIRAFLRSINKL